MSLGGKRLLSLGLSLLNATGVVGTIAMCIKESKKGNEDLAKAESEHKTTKEKVITFVKDYKYTLILGGASIVSGIGSKLIGAKTEASLIATAAMIDTGYRKYKDKVKNTLGVDIDRKIRQAVAKDESKDINITKKEGKQLFHIDRIGYFWCVPSEFWKNFHIMYKDLSGINNRYTTGVEQYNYTFRDFLSMIKAEPLKHLSDIDLNYGWSYDYLSEQYDSAQLDIEVAYDKTDNGIDCCYVTFVQEPIWNPEKWCSYIYNLIPDDEYWSGANNKVNKHLYVYQKIKNGNKRGK